MRPGKGILIFAICMGLAFFFSACKRPPDLSFTEKILVEWNRYTQKEVEKVQFEITDPADVEGIIKSFTETPEDGSGECGFNVYKLTFIGKDKQVVLRPAGDACDTVQIGDAEYDSADNMYFMGAENRKILAEILSKYGVQMSWSLPNPEGFDGEKSIDVNE